MSKNYFKQIDFSKFTSIKVGSKLDVLVINEIDDYKKFSILGLGNNLLMSNTSSEVEFAILGKEFDYIKKDDDKLYIGCATKSGKLLSYAKKNDLANFEFMGKLPGSLGGLVKMNAGLKEYEIFNYIHSIKTKDGYITKDKIEYSYRHTNIDTIVYEVVFDLKYGFSKQKEELFKKMRENQPKMPSAGSCFKNPTNDSAGRLIDAVGLKGFTKGGFAFSSEHANFLVNFDKGNFEDAMFLINLAKKKVKEEFDIELCEEIIVF